MNKRLYTIENVKEESPGKWISEISLNRDSEVFAGHFPGQPVLPGVFMLEIIASVLSEITAGKRKLQEGENIKFLSVLDPAVDSRVSVTLKFDVSENQMYNVKSEISADVKTFLKFRGKFV